MTATERPFVWARQLEDTAARWLRPGPSRDEARLLDLVVLEQYVEGLPEATAHWVCCYHPPDLTTAVMLAEDHLAAELPPAPQLTRHRVGSPKQQPPAARWRGGEPGGTEGATVWSPRNPFVDLLPATKPGTSDAGPEPRRAAQTPGLECWRCGRPGHMRRVSHGGRPGFSCGRDSSTRPRSGRDVPLRC